MTPKYTLTYFPVKGRGELPRFMFALAGVEYTDIQIPYNEWPNVKSDVTRFPLHQMPTLQVDNQLIIHSAAIDRYLATEFGFYGDNNLEKSTVDQICESIDEFRSDVGPIIYHSKEAPEKKTEILQEIFSGNKCTTRLGFFERILSSCNDGKTYFLGDKISFADLKLFMIADMVGGLFPDIFDSYPALKGLVARIGELDQIKQHIAKRKYEK